MTDNDWEWDRWERAGGMLADPALLEFHDLLMRYNRKGTGESKKAMLDAYPLYRDAACIPFWTTETRGLHAPLIVAFFARLGPAERRQLGDLRIALITICCVK